MKSTCRKKKKSVLQRYSTFGKKYFKNLVRSLWGLKYRSICIIWAYPPRNSIQACGTQVTNRVAVYLKAVVEPKRRSRDAGGLSCWQHNSMGWKQNVFLSTVLLQGLPGQSSLALHALPATCTQPRWTQKGFRSVSASSPPWCSFFNCL